MKKNTGFTLIETMVAITILTLAMAGPLFTASRSIVAAQTARDQLTASYLAQEGIEYVRMMRDNEYLAAYSANTTDVANVAWDNFLTGDSDPSSIKKCIAPAICTLDPAALAFLGNVKTCTDGTCVSEPLYFSTACGGEVSCYTQQSSISGSKQSAFVRTVQAISISPNEVKIVSTVAWNFHGTPYVVTVSDHLTSWQ